MTDQLTAIAGAARQAQRTLGSASAEQRTNALNRLAELLNERRDTIIEANQRDLSEAEATGLSGVLLKRLGLTSGKIDTLIEGVKQVAGMEDPLGRQLKGTKLDEGLELRQVTSPLGVLLIIFESRPDAVIQIGSLTLRSGNAVIMKGGKEARHSNQVLVQCLRDALESAGLDPAAVVGVEGREAVADLLALDRHIDLVIPRGSNALVRSIQNSTRIPVMGHADGICHTYLAESADLEKAVRLSVDGKCDYPSACNATETLLVDRQFLPSLPAVGEALVSHGVELRADERALEALKSAGVVAKPAHAEDFGHEFGELVLAVKTVDGMADAIEHLHTHGSGHTECIVTEDTSQAEQFLAQVDSASVFHNASTRFADGFRYGLGAEVGISTGRIHARGPVGVDGLLTTRWLLRGEGQVAADYGADKKSFVHTPL
ncbi:MAG: glutamate-5-semialdehyde dehydrogenase [Myxococcota bacterium]